MKYWGSEHIAVHDAKEGMSRTIPGYPAAKGRRIGGDGIIIGYYELEIIPGTQREEQYYDMSVEDEYPAQVVDVIIRDGPTSNGPWVERKITIDLEHFKLQSIPDDYQTSYQRAMSII